MMNSNMAERGNGTRDWLIFALLIVWLSGTVGQAQPATPATVPVGEGLKSEQVDGLFDGATLAGWVPSTFESQRAVVVVQSFRDGKPAIVLERSDYLSGISWARATPPPRMNYEISLEAMRVEGSDFFCGLTFPVGDSACTFIVGGWSGMVVGLSNVDNMDASENETSQGREFKSGRWYRIRVRVTPAKIEAWIDDEQLVDLETKDKKIDLRFGDIKLSLPLGIAAYQTKAALRNLRLTRW